MRRFALFLSAALVAASAPALVPTASSAQVPSPATAQEPPSAPGQLLVGYDIGTSAGERADARSEVRARRLEDVVRGDASRRAVELVALPAGTDRDEAMRRFERNPNVAYAEPNWVVTHEATSNDPAYTNGSMWGMYGDGTSPSNEYGSQAGEAWTSADSNTGGQHVVVGVIDEGIDVNHPDLIDNIWVNPYDPLDGLDNDGNGYVDDSHGWDFHNGNRTVYDGTGDDHGTHVAGTIAAEGGNGIGVAGVAWDATMISAKFLGPNGGYTSNAIKAVHYLTDLKIKHKMNIVASNNSWGGGGYSQALYDAIAAADAQDILFVAAAGNSSADNDATIRYPSGYDSDNVIAVASIDSAGELSSFSNFGATRVDLGAPGTGIRSTLPENKYGTYNGTSMATPHVTGGIVLASASGTVGAAALKDAILTKGAPTISLAKKTLTGKRLDVSSFQGVAPPLNSAPVAIDDSWTVPTGSTVTENVLANDSDPDGGTMAVTGTESEPLGLVVGEDGSLTYTAPPDATEFTFVYTVSDDQGAVDTGSVTIKVTATTTKTKGGGNGGGGGKPSGRGNSTK